jgi:hypothetical protein
MSTRSAGSSVDDPQRRNKEVMSMHSTAFGGDEIPAGGFCRRRSKTGQFRR